MEKQNRVIKDIFASFARKLELKIMLIKLIIPDVNRSIIQLTKRRIKVGRNTQTLDNTSVYV
jgi:hypothetical protein